MTLCKRMTHYIILLTLNPFFLLHSTHHVMQSANFFLHMIQNSSFPQGQSFSKGFTIEHKCLQSSDTFRQVMHCSYHITLAIKVFLLHFNIFPEKSLQTVKRAELLKFQDSRELSFVL